MTKKTGQVVRSGSKCEGRVIECVGEPLDWAIEIRGGRIGKKEMIEAFGNQSPASDKRIAQDQRGIVPNETVLQRWSVADEPGQQDRQDGKSLLHVEKGLDRITKLRV